MLDVDSATFAEKTFGANSEMENSIPFHLKIAKHNISLKSRNIYRQQKLLQNKTAILTKHEKDKRKQRLRDQNLVKRPLFLKGLVKKTFLSSEKNLEFMKIEGLFIPTKSNICTLPLPFADGAGYTIKIPNEFEDIYLFRELKIHNVIRHLKQTSNDRWSFYLEKRCIFNYEHFNYKNIPYLTNALSTTESNQKSAILKESLLAYFNQSKFNKKTEKKDKLEYYSQAEYSQRKLEDINNAKTQISYELPKLLTVHKDQDPSEFIYYRKIDA